jgi:hypothetical protein
MTQDKQVHLDETLLEVAATWWLARNSALHHWAKSDKESLFGIRENELEAPVEDLAMMKQAGEVFPLKPNTIMGARESLRIALEILETRERDPESTLAQGPALEIIREVIEEMGYRPDEPLRLSHEKGE